MLLIHDKKGFSSNFEKCIFLFVIFSILNLIPSLAASQIKSTGSKIRSADAGKMLEHHNQVRRDVGVGPLSWDTDLAAYAQRWADYLAKTKHCELIHRGDGQREGKLYGENIFWGSSHEVYTPLHACKSWYSEIDSYTYEKFNQKKWQAVGHYTQMVWRNTTAMGAGMAVCPSGGVIIVANYNPPGNYLGEFPY